MTADPQATPAPEQNAPPPVFGSVDEWVNEHFLYLYRRSLGGEYRWCREWWRHDEAVERLTALWHAWEAMRNQPGTGTANWHREHLDHQLPVLMGRAGPFAQCTPDAHIELRKASAAPPPPYWLPAAAPPPAQPGPPGGPGALPGAAPGSDPPEPEPEPEPEPADQEDEIP
jgi:hypothetical protein